MTLRRFLIRLGVSVSCVSLTAALASCLGVAGISGFRVDEDAAVDARADSTPEDARADSTPEDARVDADAAADVNTDTPPVGLPPGLSFVAVPGTGVGVGKQVMATLTARNDVGDRVPRVGAQVTFKVSGGTSVLTVGPTVDNADGTYSAVLTGVTEGTKVSVTAIMDNSALRTPAASLRVVNPVTSGITFAVDAANADGAGNAGGKQCPVDGRTVWADTSGNNFAGNLLGFGDPCGVGSGWEGTGTPEDPHRLAFDGLDDHVAFGAVNSLTKYTLMAWVRKTGDGTLGGTGSAGLQNVFPLFTKGTLEAEVGSLDVNFYLAIADTNRAATDYEHVGTSMNAPLLGGSTLRDAEWYVLAATLDSATGARALYVNGAVDSSATPVAGPASGSSSVMVIGGANRSNGSAEGRFRGDIALVLSYDRALSTAEIEKNCHAYSARFAMRSCKN